MKYAYEELANKLDSSMALHGSSHHHTYCYLRVPPGGENENALVRGNSCLSMMARMAAAPAPSEWPTHTTSNSRVSCSVGRRKEGFHFGGKFKRRFRDATFVRLNARPSRSSSFRRRCT